MLLYLNFKENRMSKTFAKPFLKWAGGKTQLINEIKPLLPAEFNSGKHTYIEPFVGSGAVLFWVINNYANVTKIVINDINEDLINTYKTIASDVTKLIEFLDTFQDEYHSLEDQNELKKEYYYVKRELYNRRSVGVIEQSALFIFLNRTCFNGLYRVNRRNEFNVPIGSYKRPRICDRENLLAVSKALQSVEILNGDYQETLAYANGETLFYFDPPYKPINGTSNFNSYSKDEFNDEEQIRLRDFCKRIDKLNYHWILSNSDVKNSDSNNHFFDELYSDFIIQRVSAKRNINSKGNGRGELKELLITNKLYD